MKYHSQKSRITITAVACLFLLMSHSTSQTKHQRKSTQARTQKATQGQVNKSPGDASYPPLSRYNLPNYVPDIQYPEWFGHPDLPSEVRRYLVARFNQREWLRFNEELNSETTLRIQPLLDALAAVGAAANPNTSQVRGRTPVRNRVGSEQDTPASAESRPDESIRVIDDEIGYYRRKYRIPPMIGPVSEPFVGDWITTDGRASLSISNSGGHLQTYVFDRVWVLNRAGNQLTSQRKFTLQEVMNNFGGDVSALAANRVVGQLGQYLTLTLSENRQGIALALETDTFQERIHNGKATGEVRIIQRNPAVRIEASFRRFQPK